jgi:hypothetical protein
MDVNDERADQADEERVAVHRDRAEGMLNQIAQQAKAALDEQGLDFSLFFIVPRSGDAVITFGTSGDPSDDEWGRVADVVASVVQQLVGLAGTRCREVVCATTDAVSDHPRPLELSPLDGTAGQPPRPVQEPTSHEVP